MLTCIYGAFLATCGIVRLTGMTSMYTHFFYPPPPPHGGPAAPATFYLFIYFSHFSYTQRADLKNFVDYLEEAYCCFLEGDDEAHQAITTEFSEARDGEDAGAEEFLRKLEEANDRLAQTNQEVCARGGVF